MEDFAEIDGEVREARSHFLRLLLGESHLLPECGEMGDVVQEVIAGTAKLLTKKIGLVGDGGEVCAKQDLAAIVQRLEAVGRRQNVLRESHKRLRGALDGLLQAHSRSDTGYRGEIEGLHTSARRTGGLLKVLECLSRSLNDGCGLVFGLENDFGLDVSHCERGNSVSFYQLPR